MQQRLETLKLLVDIFSTSILIEALAPSKLSTVSGYKSVKDLSIISFAYTPHAIRESLERAVEDALHNREFKLGPSLIKYVKNAFNHPLVRANTAFGYVMLATPLIYILTRAYQTDGRLRPIDELVAKYVPDVVEGLKRETCVDFYEALRRASIKHLGGFFGTIPSVIDTDQEVLNKTSLWRVLKDSMYLDLVSHEVVTGFKRVLEVCRCLRDEMPEGDLLRRVSFVHTRMLKEHIDTLVLKSKCLNAALLVKYVSLVRSFLDDRTWDVLDTYIRKQDINPGTTSDIVAAGLALYQVSTYAAEDSKR